MEKFATYVSVRYECESQKAATCRYSKDDLQTARYTLQGAINDIHVFGSREMRLAVGMVADTMPSTLAGLTGDAQVGPVDAEGLDSAMRTVRSITCFDISPDHMSCPAPS